MLLDCVSFFRFAAAETVLLRRSNVVGLQFCPSPAEVDTADYSLKLVSQLLTDLLGETQSDASFQDQEYSSALVERARRCMLAMHFMRVH